MDRRAPRLAGAVSLIALLWTGCAIGSSVRAPTAGDAARCPAGVEQPPALEAVSGAPSRGFGRDVAISGRTAAVSAWGEVFVFELTETADGTSQWRQQAHIAPSGDYRSGFGTHVALQGDTLVVSAADEGSCASGGKSTILPGECYDAGAVYVFRRTLEQGKPLWRREARLQAEATNSHDRFGASIGLEGDTLVVGAPGEGSCFQGVKLHAQNRRSSGFQRVIGGPCTGPCPDGPCWGSGAAYIFERVSDDGAPRWEQRVTLGASDASKRDHFGAAVAISDGVVAVGSPAAVYIFERAEPERPASWHQQARLDAPGAVLAFDGDTLAVGAPRHDVCSPGEGRSRYGNDVCRNAGKVALFERGVDRSWSMSAQLLNEPTHYLEEFGAALALDGDTLLVGVPGAADCSQGEDCPRVGRVDIYRQEERRLWVRQAALHGEGEAQRDHFGSSLAWQGALILVGPSSTADERRSVAARCHSRSSSAK